MTTEATTEGTARRRRGDDEATTSLPTGSTIGILGGGQLGQMLAVEAKAAGYRVVVRTDETSGGPAAQVADAEFVGPYGDEAINAAFAQCCDVVTSEFENLPATLLEWLETLRPVRPGARSITTCQHRRREKEFLAANGLPHAPFRIVRSPEDIRRALDDLGGRGILKSAAFGYDGKGQVRLDSSSGDIDFDAAWTALGTDEGVLERFVSFAREISVVGARGLDGSWVAYAPGENVHRDGILDHTISPARVATATAEAAAAMAHAIAAALDHVGTLGVEFFVSADGSLVVNEIAPRPHNSGHHTIVACKTSQFGQQLRAVTSNALGNPEQTRPAVMCNLLGDRWSNGEPRWEKLRGHSNVHLLLYGKAAARPGRKMGHLTVVGNEGESVVSDELLHSALALREAITC